MKCFLVVNQLNDPFYIDYDEGFAEHIIRVSKEKGLIEKHAVITELDANLVMQLFSPLVLSQWLLIDQTKEPCSSVSCPNGFIFVFKHVDGLLFVTINGDSTESEEFLHRKIQVFIRLMKFLFGPVSEEIGESQYSNKKSKWEFLRCLMKTWSELVATEQAFLVEAIERLSVNQLVSEKCIEILERAVKQLQSVQDQPTQHAVLLVNAKLLALYSNRSAHELRPKDILSLMVLAKTLYPQSDRLEDLFSRQYSNKKSYNSNNDDNSDGLEDEYHSAPATPACDEFRSRTSSVKSGEVGRVVTCLQEEKAGSISMSDTETIINSLVNLSTNEESSTAFQQPSLNSPVNEKTLLDLYNEKYSNIIDQVDDDIETDETETTQEIVFTDQVVVADVHNEQGGNSTDDCIIDQVVPPNKVEDLVTSTEVVDEQAAHGSSGAPNKKEETLQGGGRTGTASADTLSLASSAGETKNRSRASTVSSDRGEGEGSAVEESSLPSLRSTTSSVVSNVSNSYPALSLQTDSSCGAVNLPSASAAEENAQTPENTAVKQRPKYNPSPTSTVENSFFMLDTMPSVSVPPDKGANVYLPQTVFLETTTCQYSPHNIHTAQVLPGVTILFLSQAPRTTMADPLYQVMSNIQDLIYGRRIKLPRSRSLHVYDIINSLLSKLHNSLRKFKGRERHLISDIHARWEKEDVKHKLLEYLEKESRFHIPPEVESPLTEMYKKLRELFSLLFLYPPPENPQLKECLSQLRVTINAELLDYREYLNVKSQRNITMTSYFDKFPGLVYFIFVDRRLHQMTAPSLNISLNEGEKMNASSYLKGNIWRMYQLMMQKVTEGYTTVMLREGDFYYSHFLWFEDSAGNPLTVQDNFKPSNRFAYPGILCSSFYRDVLLQCFPQVLMNSVFCYEMFLMHVGCVHPQYIASHCRRLAAELWEMSGDAYSTLNLF